MTAALGAVEIVDAPAIPGLAFRHGRAGDWPTIADMLNRARVADGVDEVLTGEGLAADYDPYERFRIDRDVLLAELDGKAVAMSIGLLLPRGASLVLEAWGTVVPEHRRRGIGTALHRATRTRLTAEAAEDPTPGPRWLRSFALEIERADRALLEAEGFVEIRFGFEMQRSLVGPLPQHALPDGLELRPATPDRLRAILDADNEAFRDHWGHIEMTDGDVTSRLTNPDTDPELWCVAWDGDEVAGSVINMVFRDENERLGVRRGWLDHVSVRRPWRRRGVAHALIAESFRVLRDRGLTEAWLGVDAENPTGALHLYQDLGFEVVRRWFSYGRPLEGPAPEGWQPEGQLPA
jgi:mycothiol synthase